HRDRHGVEATPAGNSWRRAHDHLGRNAERTGLARFGDLRRRRRHIAGIRSRLCTRRANVTILEALPQLLPAMDADAVARIQTESERIGIRVMTNVSVKRIEP